MKEILIWIFVLTISYCNGLTKEKKSGSSPDGFRQEACFFCPPDTKIVITSTTETTTETPTTTPLLAYDTSTYSTTVTTTGTTPPIGCIYTKWRNSSPCSVTCGVGIVVQTRIALPYIGSDAEPCDKNVTQVKICDTRKNCPAPAVVKVPAPVYKEHYVPGMNGDLISFALDQVHQTATNVGKTVATILEGAVGGIKDLFTGTMPFDGGNTAASTAAGIFAPFTAGFSAIASLFGK